ncbi:hypothetical protein CSUI_011122 [Cystoisospora suis]|uniref:Uncharacterized protein n=1 Tax=Cystoisospora suis TaxID=483139 RepID=A0A2C6KFF5_9APIC|nr:hypothetical protein CSUI_011122 [Cystoisospora suis]
MVECSSRDRERTTATMSRLAPLSFFSPSFDSPPTAPTASSSWERDRLRSPCSQFRPANSEANVSERREDDRAGGEKGRGLRCLSRSEWPTGASPSHKEETEESGHREREDDRERKENSLQCIRGTEEELQVLAARVLQRLPYPQMLSIDDVCKEMIRLDLNVISKGLIYLSRGLPKALANSRLLFVGSKDACERELQAEEERKERERRQQQHQEDEEERRRRGVSHFTRKQPGRRRGRRTRGIEEKTKKHSCRFEEQERGNEADQEKSFSENSCCQNTASSSSTTEQETEEEEGTEEDEELDDDDDDEVEWFNTPLRDEQASCYPWLR